MRLLESIASDSLSPEAWDALVARDERGHLLQTWAWGELKRAFGWIPLRLAIEQDGTLAVGAQVLYRRIGPFSIGYIPKGPVLAVEEPELVKRLLQAIHARSRRMGAILLKVEPEWREEEHERRTWLAAHGFRPSRECIQPRSTILVDLSETEEQILARMKPKWRYNIRLSERKGVEVREGGAQDLGTFYELMRVTGRRDGFAIHNLDYYRRAWELFRPQGRARLFLAYYQGEPLAGLMAYAFNRQSWYLYGASADAHRELMPNHQLQWCAMKWAKSLGCRYYDLWGIPEGQSREMDESHEKLHVTTGLEGVGRFKAGFGGEVVNYLGAYDYVYLGPLYWLMNRAWERRRARGPQPTPSSA